MNIDWSKAPEGANYGDAGGNWLRFKNNQWFAWSNASGGYWFTIGKHNLQKPLNQRVIGRINPDTPWNGEGLPPVGTVCEYRLLNTRYVSKFVAVEVLAYGAEKCFLRHAASQNEFTELLCGLEFRPIRTPEQIAADEREKAAEEMYAAAWPNEPWSETSPNWQDAFRRLHDLGYRKQEAQ